MKVWHRRVGVPQLFGVDKAWFREFPYGREMVAEAARFFPAVWELEEHECVWVVPAKQSESCPVPPPRAVCCHGMVASRE